MASLRNAVLFEAGKASRILILQWAQKGALQPVPVGVALVEQDGSATRLLRQRWAAAFPSREPLPFAAIAEKDGRGTALWWDVFA